MRIAADKDPKIFTNIRKFLKEVNENTDTPMEKLSPSEARQVLIDAQQADQQDYSSIETYERTIEQGGYAVKIHIVKPKGVKEKTPVFMFFHGGGWVLGDFPTHKRLVRDLVVHSGFTAVFPDYTPSPEAKFPQAIEEAYAATDWVYKNGKEIDVDSSKMAVVGNSVGGNMAGAVAIMAKERKGPKISFQALQWPVTDSDFDNASYKEFQDERFLTRNMMIWFWNHYKRTDADLKDPHAAILLNDVSVLKDLPPALIQTAENDVLRDEGEAYARKLDEAGVPVTLTRYIGTIHDFGMLNPLAKEQHSEDSVKQIADLLKKYLK
ncbi:alpha/beta hydrolase [Gynurincola endophyticus]|uniref:alpha/beta hydrolase n=1 Tax=Gynurincola endophyticus TaxID=2479004 RepID=UPI001F27C814|nr:alpha/beta hydrolase [Gynurincola endophyticus]